MNTNLVEAVRTYAQQNAEKGVWALAAVKTKSEIARIITGCNTEMGAKRAMSRHLAPQKHLTSTIRLAMDMYRRDCEMAFEAASIN